MYFGLLHRRLLDHLRTKVRNGELTERRLARLTGMSQPHLHNVLKGVRVLSVEMADQVLRELQLSAVDLLEKNELCRQEPVSNQAYAKVPLLEQKVGPGHPFPDLQGSPGELPLLESELGGIIRPIGVRLADDREARHLFAAGDLALLAPFPENWRIPMGAGYYALDFGGSSLIRRVELSTDRLRVLHGPPAGEETCISLTDRNILEVVRARVIWIRRYLEKSRIADGSFEETGGENRPAGGEG